MKPLLIVLPTNKMWETKKMFREKHRRNTYCLSHEWNIQKEDLVHVLNVLIRCVKATGEKNQSSN
eukprot:UN07216